MVNSVGNKLQQARLSKQLSVEEASRVTRIRPDKLVDLEQDNYANFPSMSYAKGFLLIYAKFLGVDVREFADSLHTPNPVSTDDYEYLNAAASGPSTARGRRPYHFSARRERTILPVVVIGLLVGAIAFAVYIYLYVVVPFQRGAMDDGSEKKDLSLPAASPAISTLPPVPPPLPVATPIPFLRNTPPALVTAPPPSTMPAPPVAAPAPASSPAGTFDPTREVRRAEPVVPTPPAARDGVSSIAPASSPDAIKQVSIRPIRKTQVTVRKDVAGSKPIFEDWLYPGDGPLVVHGHKFWIQVKDPGAVQITQDGQPIPTPADQSDIQIE